MQYKDYYKILGLEKSASEKEIKSAFRKLAREHHPDVNAGNDTKFKEINEAYEVLGDPEKRQRYDQFGSAGYAHGSNFDPSSFGFDFGGFSGGASSTGFSDFFEMLFGQMNTGGMGGRGRATGFDPFSGMGGGMGGFQQTPPPNLDVEQVLEITLENIFHGDKKPVKTPNGDTMSVSIPKGVTPGQKIKLKGQGRQAGQRRGNLILEIRIKPHSDFLLDGTDLIYEAEISLPDLALGTEIKVPTFKGTVKLKIPPQTDPSKKLKIPRHGLPGKTDAQHGHLYVKLKPRFPVSLTAEMVHHYEALRALETQPVEPQNSETLK